MSSSTRFSSAVPYTITNDNQLTVRQLGWPDRCVCCGCHSPTTTADVRHTARFSSQITVTSYSRTTTQSGYQLGWRVPCCDACLKHWHTAEPLISIPSILLIVGFLIALGVGYALFDAGLSENTFAIVGYVIFLGVLALGGLGFQRWFSQYCQRAARRLMTPSCTATSLGVKVTSTLTHLNFAFTSDSYARDFTNLNGL